MKKCMVLIVILFAFPTIIFAESFDAPAFQERYLAVMQAGKDDMLGAIKYLDTILAGNPSNPEALIYKGSILSKIADVEFWFWLKLAHVNEGIDLMTMGMALLDGEGGADIPEERKLTMYINRGLTCYKIPSSFKQTANALRELERARSHQHFSFVNNRTRAEVLGSLSRLYRKKKQNALASELLQEAKALDPAKAEEYK